MLRTFIEYRGSGYINGCSTVRNKIETEIVIRKYDIRVDSQEISQEAKAKARYSASAEDHEIVACFLDLQEMREEPKNIEKPVVDLLLLGQNPQSVSAKLFKIVLGDKSEQKVCEVGGATCFNPGSFSTDSTYVTYWPSTRKVQVSAL